MALEFQPVLLGISQRSPFELERHPFRATRTRDQTIELKGGFKYTRPVRVLPGFGQFIVLTAIGLYRLPASFPVDWTTTYLTHTPIKLDGSVIYIGPRKRRRGEHFSCDIYADGFFYERRGEEFVEKYPQFAESFYVWSGEFSYIPMPADTNEAGTVWERPHITGRFVDGGPFGIFPSGLPYPRIAGWGTGVRDGNAFIGAQRATIRPLVRVFNGPGYDNIGRTFLPANDLWLFLRLDLILRASRRGRRAFLWFSKPKEPEQSNFEIRFPTSPKLISEAERREGVAPGAPEVEA